MAKAYWYFLVLIATLIIALAIGLQPKQPATEGYTIMFVGCWICFTIYFFAKIRYLREFSSPHNTLFLVLGPSIIGLLYNLWGHFASFLGQNLLQSSVIFLSGWGLIFASPYVLYGAILLWYCFNKYDWVYIGRKSIAARKFGIISCLVVAFFEIFYLILLAVFGHISIDLIPLLLGIDVSYLFIRHGIFGRRPTVSLLRVQTGERPSVLDEQPIVVAPPPRRQKPKPRSQAKPKPRPRPRVEPKPRARTEVKPRSSSEVKPRSRTPLRLHPQVEHKPKPRTQVKPEPSPRVKPKLLSKPKSKTRDDSLRIPKPVPIVTKRARPPKEDNAAKYEALRPKAGVLSMDDFKCIFCFQAPQLPADAHRAFVICPHCKHPAHVDEFNDWLRNSTLCSRCNAVLPPAFRSNPKLVPGKTYVEVVQYFVQKAKNQKDK